VNGKSQKGRIDHTNSVYSVAFNPDGHTAISGSKDKTIRVWEIRSRKTIRVLKGHTNYVTSVAFSPDGNIAISGYNTVRVWDIRTGILFFQVQGNGSVSSVAMTSSLIVLGENSGRVLFLSQENFPAGSQVLTARKIKGGLSARCLLCFRFFEPCVDDLGKEVQCPNCGGLVRVNSFMVEELD